MNTHVPIGLGIGVIAAVALVYLSVTVGLWRTGTGEARGRLLAGLTAWLALGVLLGALGAFATTYHRPVPVIAFGIVLPIPIGLLLLRRPSPLTRLLDSIPPRALVRVQLYRVAGVVFIVGWAAGRIPAIFALPAGIGDIAVGLAAPFVAARLGDGSERSRRLAVWWNIEGIADLVLAVALGASTSPSPIWPTLLGHPNTLISRLPLVLIPVFAVPLSVLLHVVTLRRLRAAARQRVWFPLDASTLATRQVEPIRWRGAGLRAGPHASLS
ncbi:MAG TPA: hypothetical protein VG186_06975, partial [Solirubrobacteraceae bacterium]|nr:hypothetical protein [Solirubrobacteraceae bacterium]